MGGSGPEGVDVARGDEVLESKEEGAGNRGERDSWIRRR